MDNTIKKTFRGIEYQIWADHQTLNFPNLETFSSWCPSDLESIHLSKLLSARECHRDSVKHRQMLPAAGGSQGCHCPWARDQHKPQHWLPFLWCRAVFQGDVQRTLIQVDFGDGIAVSYVNLSSMEDGIKHVYHNVGIFRVTVQVDNSLGSDSAVLYLHVTCMLLLLLVYEIFKILCSF